MTTETTAPAERAKQISDRLLEIAPYPETGMITAAALARYLAVRAQVIYVQQLSPNGMMSRQQIDLMTVLFAAAHALDALGEKGRDNADQVAAQIHDAWEDGAGIGELLWGHLGSEAAAEAASLAEELLGLQAPKTGILAHAPVIRDALQMAVIHVRDRERADKFIAALSALEDAASAEEPQS